MAASDLTLAQDGGAVGGGNVRFHPYVVAIVRWCVSCVWSAATLVMHRLMMRQLPSIQAPKLQHPRAQRVSRAASTTHIHPEPTVECVVLREPDCEPTVDFVFVHGLYGSLENTWRQGDWRTKYKIQPNKIPLRRPQHIPNPLNDQHTGEHTEFHIPHNDNYEHCICNCNSSAINADTNVQDNVFINEKISIQNCNNENIADMYITESFYSENFVDKINIVDNYEMQARFVRDLFHKENEALRMEYEKCNEKITNNIQFDDVNFTKNFFYNENKSLLDDYENKFDDNITFVNETDKNINDIDNNVNNDFDQNGNDNHVNNDNDQNENDSDKTCDVGCGCICDKCYSKCWPRDWLSVDYPGARVISINYTSDPHLWRPLWVKECKRLRLQERAEQMSRQLLELGAGRRPLVWVGHSKGGLFIKQIYCQAYEAHQKYNEAIAKPQQEKSNPHLNQSNPETTSATNWDTNVQIHNLITNSATCQLQTEHENENFNLEELKRRSSLWSNSAGFMFYSVPHRGSPLADIKTPITARSIELLEISKDCSLVLSLQDRWLEATSRLQPAVRSLVETSRTLMSVLWLRIVSEESADAGIGALCGVSVDHREICKPSSRHCVLYTELTRLADAALGINICSEK